jgi:TonB family protein
MNAQIAFQPGESFSVQRGNTGRAPRASSLTTAANELLEVTTTDAASNVSNVTINSASCWLPATEITASRFTTKKGFLFGVVVALHVVAAVIFSQFNTSATKPNDEPLQVVMLADNHSEPLNTPKLPTPVLTLPEMALPAEPLIDVAEPAPTAITVTAIQQPATADATPTAAAPKLVSGVEYLHAPIVKFPPAARALKQHGTVIVRVLIDASGTPTDVQVQHSSGYRQLDDAALSAVLKALFKPKTENGSPVAVYALVPIEFAAA